MTNKRLNIILISIFVCFILFFTGAIVYDSYIINKKDSEYNQNNENIEENNGMGESSQDKNI